MAEDQLMVGKTCLITGATGGIGKETARGLRKMGATVVIVGRNTEKTAATAAELREAEGVGQVDALVGDLSSMREVRRIAGEFRQRYARLDVLINNAGAIFMRRRESADGLEMTFALNHLSYFLLTNLLVNVLRASVPARVINVSSGAHFGGNIHFADLQFRRGYAGFRAYSQSKLANVLFTYELARQLNDSGVTANALHPGFVASNFGLNNGRWFIPIFRLVHLWAISAEEGARTTLYLASSPEVEGVTGKYFDKCQPVPSSRNSYDERTAARLWEVSRELAGLAEGEWV